MEIKPTALDDVWAQAYGLTPESPAPLDRTKAAEARMFKGTGLNEVELDPLKNPLWLNDDESEDRKRIMKEMQAWSESTMPCGFDNHRVTLPDGRQLDAGEFFQFQHARCYELLSRGVDVRMVAREVFWPIERVLALKRQYWPE